MSQTLASQHGCKTREPEDREVWWVPEVWMGLVLRVLESRMGHVRLTIQAVLGGQAAWERVSSPPLEVSKQRLNCHWTGTWGGT
jgi:hypothetical protein